MSKEEDKIWQLMAARFGVEAADADYARREAFAKLSPDEKTAQSANEEAAAKKELEDFCAAEDRKHSEWKASLTPEQLAAHLEFEADLEYLRIDPAPLLPGEKNMYKERYQRLSVCLAAFQESWKGPKGKDPAYREARAKTRQRFFEDERKIPITQKAVHETMGYRFVE